MLIDEQKACECERSDKTKILEDVMLVIGFVGTLYSLFRGFK